MLVKIIVELIIASQGLRNGERDTYLSSILANFMSLC